MAGGDTANADFSPAPAGDGASPLLYALAAVATGSPSGIDTIFPLGFSRAIPLSSGQTVDFVIMGQGIDTSLTDANVLLPGALSLRPGTVKTDRGFPLFINGVSYPLMRFTADVPQMSAQSYATIVILSNSGGIASYTGGVVLLPPQ